MTLACNWSIGWGWRKKSSSKASLMGSAPQHKGAFQAPIPSVLPCFNGKRSDSREEMSLLPSLSWGQDQAHLPAMSHCDEGADGLEGTSATGQQVGPVVGL